MRQGYKVSDDITIPPYAYCECTVHLEDFSTVNKKGELIRGSYTETINYETDEEFVKIIKIVNRKER